MGTDVMKLPRIYFSGVDPSAPGTGTWSAVRAQVMDALATFGCFDAEYPALTPEQRAALFDGAVRPLFALPVDAKRRNYYGADKPFHGYLGGIPGYEGYRGRRQAPTSNTIPTAAATTTASGKLSTSFNFLQQILLRREASNVWFDFALLRLRSNAVHGVAARIFELEEAVRRMVMEGLGVAKYHDALSASTWHLFSMSEYQAPNAAEKTVRYGSHQDTNLLSVECQHEVEGLEMQTRDGQLVLVKPSPTSLVVMVGQALRSPDELVDNEHPPRFKPHYNNDYIRYCVSEEGTRQEDKLKAFCGV
ncbi:hypothetical protein C2845_PM05G28480 [Panicum miliaceum]|uniref:Isopenicillin N synthase-like Fe(2+) 2OG dioxygenase domain-containing protein n=1 Tax=Panicum miliaceum TaxID=4540 RepID=A0A3L6SZ89_PANMI|nr:hypothetical protein C2845_PM05G28480 [Panicum miliaceum]